MDQRIATLSWYFSKKQETHVKLYYSSKLQFRNYFVISTQSHLELEKQRLSVAGGGGGGVDNRDSGIAEGGSTVTVGGELSGSGNSDSMLSRHHAANGNVVNHNGVVLRKSAINNSLLDLADSSEKMARRGSVGSLDSGMSISFQSNSVGSMCLPGGAVDPRHCYHNHNHYHRGPGPGGSDKRLYHS